jgi:hypothetical protein
LIGNGFVERLGEILADLLNVGTEFRALREKLVACLLNVRRGASNCIRSPRSRISNALHHVV